MSSWREVLIRILAVLQRKTLIETKNRTLKCLKWHYLTVWSIKNVAVLTEDGAFALFFRPHLGGFDSSRVPTPGNLPSKAKKMLMPGGQPGGGGVWGLGAGGIDWCIILKMCFLGRPHLRSEGKKIAKDIKKSRIFKRWILSPFSHFYNIKKRLFCCIFSVSLFV